MCSSNKSCPGDASCNPRCYTRRQLPSSGRFPSPGFDSKKYWITPRLTGRRWLLIHQKNICRLSIRAPPKRRRNRRETPPTRSSPSSRFRGKRTPDLKLDRDVPLPNIVATGAIVPAVPLDATRPSLSTRIVAPETQVVAPAPDVQFARDRVV